MGSLPIGDLTAFRANNGAEVAFKTEQYVEWGQCLFVHTPAHTTNPGHTFFFFKQTPKVGCQAQWSDFPTHALRSAPGQGIPLTVTQC